MKLANHKITMTALMCVSILFLSNPSMATDVGGIINADTTWDLAGSPYNITSAIQIDEGITLTIEPGVVVNSAGYPFGIEVWGALTAIGNENSTIILTDVSIMPGDTALQAEINIQFAEINITQSDVRLAARGSLILKDSKIMDYSSGGDSFDIDSRSADSYIERNIFYRVHGLFINPEGKVVHVRNNIFYGNSYGLKPVGSSGLLSFSIIVSCTLSIMLLSWNLIPSFLS